MLVPKYWADAKARGKDAGRRVTVLRFGWSDESQDAALEHARSRAEGALERILAGEELQRRERKVPYNGADGLPIREEILESFADGDPVITRNSYGAHCLNVSDVLFADVDFDQPRSVAVAVTWVLQVLGFLGGGLAAAMLDWQFPTLAFFAGAFVGMIVTAIVVDAVAERVTRARGGTARISARRARRFVERHPEWRVRLYGTPNGLRMLVMHRTFDPESDLPDIEAFFRAVHADPTYVLMCRLQRCFRARLTAKPWRIGITGHLRPRPGVWPVEEHQLPLRQAWVERYDEECDGFAACRLLEIIGSERVDPRAAEIRDLHDDRARATTDLPLA